MAVGCLIDGLYKKIMLDGLPCKVFIMPLGL